MKKKERRRLRREALAAAQPSRPLVARHPDWMASPGEVEAEGEVSAF